MKISFTNNKLKKILSNETKCIKVYGSRATKIIMQRLDDMYDADCLEDLKNFPGRYHELVGDRKGQWACDLVHPYRLIFTPEERPIPTDNNGKYIWIKINAVIIIEIVDYHE